MKRAFTLVELLVVVAIIAVLVALLLPSLAAAKQKALTVRCLANLKGCADGFAVYAASWDGRIESSRTINSKLPDGITPTIPTYSGNTGGNIWMWNEWMCYGRDLFDNTGQPVYIDPKSIICPANNYYATMLQSVTSKNGSQAGHIGYGLYNPGNEAKTRGWYWDVKAVCLNPTSSGTMSVTADIQNTSQITGGANIVMLADTATYNYTGTPPYTDLCNFTCNSSASYYGRIQSLHGSKGELTNAVFYDGHGETTTPLQIRQNTYSMVNYFIDCNQLVFKYNNPPALPGAPIYQAYPQ